MHHPVDPVSSGPARAALAAIGVAWAVLAVAWWQLRDVEAFAPHLWPVVFAVASASALALAVWPASSRWWRWRHQLMVASGALTVLGVSSRAGAVVLNLLEGGVYRSPWQGVIAIVVYLVAAAALLYCWHAGVAVWVDRSRGRDGSGSWG